MISPGTGAWLALIAAAAGIAILAGSDLALAVLAGTVAVALALLLGLYAVLDARGGGTPTPRVPESRPALRIRRALAGDAFEREGVVLLLDHVERSGPTPGLPSRPRSEMATLTSMDPSEFRRYVRTRIDQLERDS